MNIFRNDIIKNVALFPVNDGLIKTEQLPNIFAKVEFYVSYISFLSYLDLKILKKNTKTGLNTVIWKLREVWLVVE